MADKVLISNATTYGYDYDDKLIHIAGTATGVSVHGAATMSALGQNVFVAQANGRFTDVGLAAQRMALSASGFVSGTVLATLRINSVAVCSTDPSITMAGSAGAVGQTATNKTATGANAVSGIVNTASAAFSTGDIITVDWNTFSVGSAAATSSGIGLSIFARWRNAAT